MWHPTRLIKEWECVDLSMDTLHLTYPLVLFGSEGSYSHSFFFCHLEKYAFSSFFNNAKDHFLLISYDTKCPLCVDVPLNTYSFNHSFNSRSDERLSVTSTAGFAHAFIISPPRRTIFLLKKAVCRFSAELLRKGPKG